MATPTEIMAIYCGLKDCGTFINPYRLPLLTQKQDSPIIKQPKIGRNDPCHCGSGKKFKQCHGRNR